MKNLGLALAASLLLFAIRANGQIENSIKLNEVMTNNTESLQDEYGEHLPWVEIANASFTTYNVRGMFITTDRSVLDPGMSVPERMKRMSIIPSGEERTSLGGQQHLVLYLNSKPAKGALHLDTEIEPGEGVWVALYNGNAVDIIDSVTVPAMAENRSFARKMDGKGTWEVKAEDAVTPGISNFIEVSETKIQRLKRDDPNGFGITILAMGIVFFCLALLFVFFTCFGSVMRQIEKIKAMKAVKPAVEVVDKTIELAEKAGQMLQDGSDLKGIEKEVYIAVISMALKQYQDDVHDVESGVITIRRKSTDWTNEFTQMTQFHE